MVGTIRPPDKQNVKSMEAWLQHLITQSVAWSLMAVGLVAFFESLALVGLLLNLVGHHRRGRAAGPAPEDDPAPAGCEPR